MKRLIKGVGVWAFLVGAVSTSEAVSVSQADLFYSSYGQARHFDASNEFLGSRGDRYDGVSFSSFVPGETATITVRTMVGQLFGTGEFEWLSMWIDWDQDRTWGGGEEVLDLNDFWFDAGEQTYQFDLQVPDDAVLGQTWMRTRFSFDGDLEPAGDVVTGEVEDYRVRVGTVGPVPEPSTLLLLATGLLIFVGGFRGRPPTLGA